MSCPQKYQLSSGTARMKRFNRPSCYWQFLNTTSTCPVATGRLRQTYLPCFVALRGSWRSQWKGKWTRHSVRPSTKRKEGAEARLEYLHRLLELEPSGSGTLRYQLLHRTAAAILLAQRFHAGAAALVIHSFSPESRWFGDFEAFGKAMGAGLQQGHLTRVGIRGGIPFYAGWAAGDQRFRADLTTV